MKDPELRDLEIGEQELRDWLRWLALEPHGCYLCHRISLEAQMNAGRVRAQEIRGVELTRKEVLRHLSQCVPERQKRIQ
jgi:hypothetical protein